MTRRPRHRAEKRMPSGVRMVGGVLHTVSSDPRPVYGERVSEAGDGKYLHAWSPWRSKLASAILRGMSPPLHSGSGVLYLGAASGTTASHISDIAAEGVVHAVDISPVEFARLVDLSRRRSNIIPILGNARTPERYAPLVSRVDVIYQDIAQRDQVDIYLRNVALFGCREGILCLKTRSVDAASPGRAVLRAALHQLEARLHVEEVVDLSPCQKEHWAVRTGAGG